MTDPVRYLSAENRTHDDFNDKFTMKPGEIVYDAATERPGGYPGPWATMTQSSYLMYGFGKLGTGYGQKYVRQTNGQLHKVEG